MDKKEEVEMVGVEMEIRLETREKDRKGAEWTKR